MFIRHLTNKLGFLFSSKQFEHRHKITMIDDVIIKMDDMVEKTADSYLIVYKLLSLNFTSLKYLPISITFLPLK